MFHWDARQSVEDSWDDDDDYSSNRLIQGPFEGIKSNVVVSSPQRRYEVQLDQRSLDDFQQSQQSCDFCKFICHTTSLVWNLQEERSYHYIVALQYELFYGRQLPNRESVPQNIDIRVDTEDHSTTSPSFVIKLKPTVAEDNIKPIQSSTLEWLQECLVDCHNSHQFCREGFDATWLPTRLIDIGDGHNTSPKLVLAEEVLTSCQDPRYITLSYRWGLTPFISLKTSNLDEFKIRMDKTSLPRTFQDAILVCQFLQFRYIWIDSLCIIQDSIEDWQRESKMMSSVYSNGVYNLAASNGEGPHHGLELERVADAAIKTLKVKIPYRGSMVLHDFLYNYGPSWYMVRDEAPLYQRAWVYQESIRNIPTAS